MTGTPKGSIDSHQHNWQVDRFAYTWLKPACPSLQRDYQPNAVLKVSSFLANFQPKHPTAKTLWSYVEIALELLGTARRVYRLDPA